MNGRVGPPEVRPLLEDDFGFAIGMMFRAYAKAVEATVANLTGGPRGYFILAAAVRGEASSQRFLADRLGIDRTMMTYLLDDLEEAGLVERQADPSDRRSRRIVATTRGAKLWEGLHAEVNEIDRQLLSALPEESQTAFQEMVYTIARQVTAREQAEPGEVVAESAADKKPEHAVRRRRTRPNL
ncbi:MarR family winged helix-turn-helix transcriptional regulator [Streptomyces sp. NPDC127168]|uniref:MarR family winged helix-turn-helix transcriptional regulator n=1 Tax=unclassified Streptomyces TaxID=2593676 RepID=UPI0036280CE7